MKLEKITDKYTLYKDNEKYILDLGSITNGEDTTTIFRVKEVLADKFSVESTCGCSTGTSNKISPVEVEISIRYKNCDSQFSKTIKLIENKKITELKIKGTCK